MFKSQFMNLRFLVLLFGSIVSMSLSGQAFAWVDLTERVKAETLLDDNIREGCRKHCQGNRRHGDLVSLHVKRLDSQQFSVKATAYGKNHHHVDTFIGGGIAVYEYTVTIYSEGTLNLNNCKIRITHVEASGGINDIDKRVERTNNEKEHDVPNCLHLLRGL